MVGNCMANNALKRKLMVLSAFETYVSHMKKMPFKGNNQRSEASFSHTDIEQKGVVPSQTREVLACMPIGRKCYIRAEKSFIFFFKNNDGLHHLNPVVRPDSAITAKIYYGPVFGGGHDLHRQQCQL
ncbi:uncharacterized protein LOC124454080 [Xenia sp. Carnegie-2017]|uniref:uncharacterized protein LOC124454080 n=1 Tax=Xenia sp. Carnegie-2017 TaxID=2897299 RepID=UPI001F045448|nr:uncharacterized protein LOC124454080 [Xenia sp. Carnegie-2017]